MKRLKERAYAVLRWSEKYTKTDMVYLAHGSFWLNGVQIITAVVSLLLAIAFANLLSQESYGIYKYIISVYGLFGAITLSGLGTAVARAVARNHEGEFIRALKANLRWDMLITLASFSAAVYYYLHANQTLALGLVIIGVFAPVLDTAELYPSYLTGKKDFRAGSILSLTRTVIAAIWLFGTILLFKNPIIIVFSYFFIHTVTTSLIVSYILRSRKLNKNLDPETIRFAKHTSFINNFSGFTDRIDNILVFHYLGPIQLAVYNFAQAIPEYLAGFTKNIGSLAMPKFAQADKKLVQATIYHKVLQMFFFGAVISAIYILFSPLFFSMFLPKYLASVSYSRFYSLILLIPGALPMAFIDSQMAIREKYIISLSSGIIKVVALTLGIIYYGIWGVIVARVLVKAVSLVIAFYFVKRV